MSYQLKVIKDSPIGFWPLDESSGTTATDKSGCGNNATYVGSPAANILPLVSGGISGTEITNTAYITLPITKDYYSKTVSAAFGTKYTSDNDFSMEVWIHPSIESTNVTRIFADTANNIGIFWDRGDIVFKVSATDEVRYCLSYTKKVIHIVGTYTPNNLSLYIDGYAVATKELSEFKFTNTSISLQIGPTSDSGDSFIVDAPAVYRYALGKNSVYRHYVNGNVTSSAIQVVHPDQGTLFSLTSAVHKPAFDYVYPVNRAWTEFLNEDTYYDINGKFISFNKTETSTPKTFIINDFTLVPTELNLTTSKIEWRNDHKISVETSIDGTTYLPCVNGEAIPQYTKDSFSTSGKLYIRITMTTPDASKYLPRLSFFAITFYANDAVYADNYGDKLSSTTEYSLGSINYPILSRNYTNGIRPKTDSGFKINTKDLIRSLEFFYTPPALTDSGLVSSLADTLYSACNYSWRNTGTVSKTNISKIYVNNVDKTNETNISNVFNPEELHHVIIVFASPISDDITFNYSLYGAVNALYKNIALYAKALSASEVETHYEIYTGRPVSSVTESAMTLTESGFIAYNNDWIVLQTV